MSCKKYEKWVYLFWDERLNPSQKDEFKKHLAECKECQKKLSFLESMEGKAKEIHAKEPPQEYWEAFSRRISDKITLQTESTPAFGLKKFLENIFVISPWKIRVAAGMVSIVLVFIIGKLYMDRGNKIVPSVPIAPAVKEQPLRINEIEKKKTPPGEETQEKIKSSFEKPKKMPESVVSDQGQEKPVTQKIKGSEKPVLMKDQEVAIPTQTPEEKSTPPSPSPQTEAIAPNVAKQNVPTEAPPATGTGGEMKAEKLHEVATLSREGKETLEKIKGGKAGESLDILSTSKPSFISAPSANQYVVDQKAIPKIDEADTLISAEDLGGIIRRWKDHFADNPADTLNNQGYLQVATAYLLLGRLSADSTVINQGSYLIEEYMNRTKDPAIKDQLSDKLEKIKALGKK